MPNTHNKPATLEEANQIIEDLELKNEDLEIRLTSAQAEVVQKTED
jgi:hypothetical protein